MRARGRAAFRHRSRTVDRSANPRRTDRLADTVSYSTWWRPRTRLQECQLQAAGYGGRRRGRRRPGGISPHQRGQDHVHKPHAPIAAIFEDVGVVLTRRRQEPARGGRPDRAGRMSRRPRDVFKRRSPHLRMTQAALDCPRSSRLCHTALGRGAAGPASSCLHRDRRPALDPHALLFTLHKIEHKFGRDRARETRWGPRTLDLDLIAYDDLSIPEARTDAGAPAGIRARLRAGTGSPTIVPTVSLRDRA